MPYIQSVASSYSEAPVSELQESIESLFRVILCIRSSKSSNIYIVSMKGFYNRDTYKEFSNTNIYFNTTMHYKYTQLN